VPLYWTLAEDQGELDPRMDGADLYQEETFTDRRVGTIRRLTPVTGTGEQDNERSVLYVGQTQIMTPMGTLPLSFEIEGESLAEVAENFGDAASVAVEETKQQLEDMRREAASGLIVPGAGGGPDPLAGMAGGNKIRMP
jgi:hypothetical protein